MEGSKEISSKPMDMLKAGGSGGDNSGPTGSSRHYPKGKGTPSTSSPSFNPQKVAVPSIYVGGV